MELTDDTKIIENDISIDNCDVKYFTVKLLTLDSHNVDSGEIVKFTINGKTTTVKTDTKRIAKIKITQIPKHT